LPKVRASPGTDLHATRQLSLFDSRLAQGALHHSGGKRLVVFVGRDVERAGDHAVTAAHTERRVVADRAAGVLFERLYEAGRSTRRLQTVVALFLDIQRFAAFSKRGELVDHRIVRRVRPTGLFEDIQIVEGRVGVGQFVDCVAGLLAQTAADAARGVVKHAEAAGVAGEMLVARRAGGGPDQGAGADRAQPAEKFSPGNRHVHSYTALLRGCTWGPSLFAFRVTGRAVVGRGFFDPHVLVAADALQVIGPL
jgi:hypothetical protein